MQNAPHQEATIAVYQFQAEMMIYGCTLAQLNQMLEHNPLEELVPALIAKARKAAEAGKDNEATQTANCVSYLKYRAKSL